VDDPPAIYDASFTVGAYDAGHFIAGFSSRGPVTIDGSGRLKPDLAHFTNYQAPLATGVPYLVSFHDMTLSLFPECHPLRRRLVFSKLRPFVARRARLVLVPSESTRQDIVRILRVHPARVRVIPYAASSRFRPIEAAPQRLETAYGFRPPYILHVGNLEPRKNLTRSLRAFARVAPSLPGHCFVVVGQRGHRPGDGKKKAAVDNVNPRVQEWEELMWKFQQALPWAKPGQKWILMDKIFELP
jgi:glycosyltransferase involved in cell wall biosynthesis